MYIMDVREGDEEQEELHEFSDWVCIKDRGGRNHFTHTYAYVYVAPCHHKDPA